MREGGRQAAYEIVYGDTHDLPDVRDFVETLGALFESFGHVRLRPV